MDTKTFRDKVYACWLGKNIGGTLGGPLEGIMELLDIKNYTQRFVEPVENDDLDLQLVALDCLERNNGVFNTSLWAQAWLDHVHFQYDEYGHALTNLRKGLRTPLAGHYNNYFTNCMGSPIRSELWGIVCAGLPDLAAYYAFQDACLDHAGGEGVWGEVFFAVLESLAFENSDIYAIIDRALAYLPADCETARAVRLLLACRAENLPWQETRSRLIDAHGSENFTLAPLNIAFTLIGLLYGEGFTERLLITTNCGYDTDCTCATIASIMGILYGSAYIDSMWTAPLSDAIVVSPPVNGFRAPASITELAERSMRAHDLVNAIYAACPDKSRYAIDGDIDREIIPQLQGGLALSILHQNACPALSMHAPHEVILRIHNTRTAAIDIHVGAVMEENAVIDGGERVSIPADGWHDVIFHVSAKQKSAGYHGSFSITEWQRGSLWTTYAVPLALQATRDWSIAIDAKQAFRLSCSEDRFPVERLPLMEAEMLVAETTLHVPSSRMARLIVVCRQPVELLVDGETVVHCDEETAEIPAYHRADKRKSADLSLKQGKHSIRIKVRDAKAIENLYFYVVSPENYCAADIEFILAP